MRLVTRSDFDGLACAVLLVDHGVVNEYKFVHPKDVQDGKVEVTENDVLANVPYAPGCGLWFDHHSSEVERLHLTEKFQFQGRSARAPSCARIIYDYYGGAKVFAKFDQTGLMAAVDKADSGQFTPEDILNPKGWVLLSFIMDPRTSLGRFREYRISNYQLMEDMIQYCRTMTPEQILQVPDVQERATRYFEQEAAYEKMIRENSRTDGNVLILDLRNVEEIVSGNRFREYVMFPKQNVSVRALWGLKKQNVVLSVGHSITNRTCRTNVGALLLQYGGGGHGYVGTCQAPIEKADATLAAVVAALKKE